MAERGGHRLKAAPMCVPWFARERPVRAGRRPTVIGVQVRTQYECGWYRGRFAFRPSLWGRRAFYFRRAEVVAPHALKQEIIICQK